MTVYLQDRDGIRVRKSVWMFVGGMYLCLMHSSYLIHVCERKKRREREDEMPQVLKSAI